ncbi:MAG: RidA family protein [Xanthomonadaceae bacterium]|nr:RidA family protein [Xanthomonadaceae bacterium]MDP2186647.1 RidA family protein [Xanthomonadales bacterium]MDZ4114525.1 RidA family protein [Xanthomonadaceae bacterium]MDZ4378961.1 RidA family protein [Xanthomonadaceae bacterium]
MRTLLKPHLIIFSALLAISQLACAAQGPGANVLAFDPEARLAELGIELPASSPPVANYVPAVRSGNWVFLSGMGPCGEMGPGQLGKLGAERSVEDGYRAARRTAVCLLAALKAEVGDLKKVRRIVRVFGMVNATPDFTQHPQVINGASDLLVAVFGERGRHARAAVGMASLPFNIPVEIEMQVELEP